MLGKAHHRIDAGGLIAFESAQPAGFESAGHRHAGGSLCLVLAGGFEELAPAPRRFARGDLVLTAAGDVQDLRFGPAGGRCFVAEWSAAYLAAAGIERLPERTATADEPALAGLAWRAYAELRTGYPDAELGFEEALLALLTDLPVVADTGSSAADPPWVGHAFELLRDGYRRPLSLSRIAAEVGVHRVTLAREFRRRTGRSVGETIRLLRVGCATDLLARTTLPLAEVALAAGFADQSHLCRVVGRATGRTPGWFRRRLGGASNVQDGGRSGGATLRHHELQERPRDRLRHRVSARHRRGGERA